MKNENGFSLLEVIIAAGLLGMIALGFGQVMKNATKDNLKAQVDTDYLLTYNEIIAILSDPKNCLDSFPSIDAVPTKLIYKGQDRYSVGTSFGSTNSKISSYTITGYNPVTSPNDAKLVISFAKKGMLGSGTVNKSINLYLKVNGNTIEACRSLSSSDTDLWTRGTGTSSGDVYYSGNVGVGGNTPAGALHVTSGEANLNGVYVDSDEQAFLQLRGKSDMGRTYSALYLVRDTQIATSNSFFIAYKATVDEPKDGLVIGRWKNNVEVDVLAISSNGNVGIGKNVPSEKLHVSGNLKVDGTIVASGTITSASDIKLKKNIKPLHGTLDKIMKLKGVVFNWIDSKMGKKKQIGFIAQDVEKVFPELVVTDRDGVKSVAYQNLTAPLVEAMKEQQQEIEKLKLQNIQMMKQIKYLEVQQNKK